MSTHVNYRGVGGQNIAKNGQRSLRMTPYIKQAVGLEFDFNLVYVWSYFWPYCVKAIIVKVFLHYQVQIWNLANHVNIL